MRILFLILLQLLFFISVSGFASKYEDSVLNIINQTDVDSVVINNYYQLKNYFTSKEDYNKVYYYSQKLLNLLPADDYEEIGDVYNDMSYALDCIGNYPEGLQSSLKALEFYKKVQKRDKIAYVFNDIAIYHYYENNYDEALKYFNSAYPIFKELNDTLGVGLYYNNVANIMFDSDSLDKAIIYYEKAYSIAALRNDLDGMSVALNNIGDVYVTKGQVDKGIHKLKKSYDLVKDKGVLWGMVTPLRSLSNAYQLIGEYDSAIVTINKSIAIADSLNSPAELVENYSTLAEIYSKLNDYKNAFFALQKHKIFSDSVYGEERLKIFQELESKYQFDQQNQQIQLLNKQNEIQELEHKQALNKKYFQNVFLITVLCIIIGVLIFVYINLRNKKKLNSKLLQQNEVIQNQKKKLEDAFHQIEIKHEEITSSIEYAKRIQTAIMPGFDAFNCFNLDSFILYLPKDVVAGDFFWAERTNNKLFFAAADCTGHGVPGAMVSVVCSSALSKSVVEENIDSTGKILDKTREIVIEKLGKSGDEIKDGMDISLCKLSFPQNERNDEVDLQWSGANNPLWICRNGSNEIEIFKPDSQPIGEFDFISPFREVNLKLAKGDIIYVFSDGFQDQFGGPKGKKLKSSNFSKLLLSIKDLSLAEQKIKLHEAFLNWKGEIEQIDDVCVIGVRV